LLDMGAPVKIVDLAKQLIRLSGFTEAQIPIKIVGTRPGEKLFEELSTTAEDLSSTTLRKVYRCKPVVTDSQRLLELEIALLDAAHRRDGAAIRKQLTNLDIGYSETP